MFPANAHTYFIDPDDRSSALRRLAALDREPPIAAPALVAEREGLPVAALSLSDGRSVADPSRRTGPARIMLRLRARGIEAHRRTPSVRDRVVDALRRSRADAPSA